MWNFQFLLFLLDWIDMRLGDHCVYVCCWSMHHAKLWNDNFKKKKKEMWLIYSLVFCNYCGYPFIDAMYFNINISSERKSVSNAMKIVFCFFLHCIFHSYWTFNDKYTNKHIHTYMWICRSFNSVGHFDFSSESFLTKQASAIIHSYT